MFVPFASDIIKPVAPPRNPRSPLREIGKNRVCLSVEHAVRNITHAEEAKIKKRVTLRHQAQSNERKDFREGGGGLTH